ncbi:killer cell lectin-like receptor subfamily F member 1 isoform X2 [Sorex fumeus]|uniref:killer cell lectin-like receptor subfamily F member 1 isoform X2 n=1 Tax=Sorex fumeus TaxID=62283 RepID=UPI0024ACFE21|nr:killer cell lectin-like receptor subfamily F member 1 isoform X2 [Sorex fumeus]
MEYEERYMTLNVPSKMRSSGQTSQLKCQDSSAILHWYKILLGISGTVNGILVLILISLILLVSQGVLLNCQKDQKSNVTQHEEIENLRTDNDTRGNRKHQNSGPCVPGATEHTEFCPSEWFKFENKCYWFSDAMKTWSDSYRYCLGRNSHLLMVQDQLEMVLYKRPI